MCANSCSCSKGDEDRIDKDDKANELVGGQCYLARQKFKARSTAVSWTVA